MKLSTLRTSDYARVPAATSSPCSENLSTLCCARNERLTLLGLGRSHSIDEFERCQSNFG